MYANFCLKISLFRSKQHIFATPTTLRMRISKSIPIKIRFIPVFLARLYNIELF